MIRCTQPGCRWQAIAASREAAEAQLDEHLREEHLEDVPAELPEGVVQVKVDEDDDWQTLTLEDVDRLFEDARSDD